MYEILTRYAYQRTPVMGSGPAIGGILVVEWNDCGTFVVATGGPLAANCRKSSLRRIHVERSSANT